MELACSPDIYQEKTSELFIDMISVIVYQDDILVLTSSSFDDHLWQLGNVFKWFHCNNLQVNTKKSSFCALETKYLGFILTIEVIKLQQQNVNAILQVTPPRNIEQVWSFVSMLNHYKAMIPCCSHLLTPFTALTKKNIKFESTTEHQQAFDSLKKFPHSRRCPRLPRLLRSLQNLHRCLKIPNRICHYPKGQATCILFKETYWSSNEIHHHRTQTACDSGNTSWVQVYSPQTFDYNLHWSQESYLLNFTTDCITHWWLIVEGYGPNIVYLPGKCNIIADALSRLPKLNEPHDESTFLEEIFALNEQLNAFPIAFDVISKEQLADNKIQYCITNIDPDFKTRIYFNGKIAIPANLCSHVLTCYHKNLLHPGANWMFHTILQHFTWPSLHGQVENFVKHCNTCQHYKAQRKKYARIPIPDKQQIANPWHSIAVDTIGPWIIPQLPHSSK